MSTKKLNKRVKRALERMDNWSPRDSSCPICKRDFRYGCKHSIREARKRLEQNILVEIINSCNGS